jgi:hypothetical protein
MLNVDFEKKKRKKEKKTKFKKFKKCKKEKEKINFKLKMSLLFKTFIK